MGLTFRTGSGGKGSALTIEELDNNFRYFTGSHPITGSFTISGSLDVEGNITASGNISASKLTVNTASISKIVDGPDGNANAGITIITSDNTSLEFSDTIVGSTEEYDLTLTSGGALKINNAGSKFSGSAGNITASANISASGNIISNLSLVNTSTLDPTVDDDAKLTVFGNAIFGEGANGKVILSDDYLGGELGVMTVSDHTIAAKFTGEGYRYGGLYGAEPLRIADNGRVGIGVAVPDEKLDINGNVKIGEGTVGYVIVGDDHIGGELGLVDFNTDNFIAVVKSDGSFQYGGTSDNALTISSSNVSASGNITGQTGSFVGGLVLTSPNGTEYVFTTNNDGHLSLTGSAV